MKQKFTALDVRCMVCELRSKLIGMKLANVYDVNPKTYLLKFAKTDQKNLLLVESGNEMHITDFSRKKNTAPSGFSMKLRKHLRTRRLNRLKQLGIDRVVDFEFGAGETTYHLIVEFYAGGNILLTNHNYIILAFLRAVPPEEGIKIAVNEPYPVDRCRQLEMMSKHRLLEILQDSRPTETLKQVLLARTDYGAALVEHVILEAGLRPNLKTISALCRDSESAEFRMLLEAIQKVDELLVLCEEEIQKVSAKGIDLSLEGISSKPWVNYLGIHIFGSISECSTPLKLQGVSSNHPETA